MIRFTTAGESHGPALVSILEGMPAGLPLVVDDVNVELARRQQGYGRGRRMQIEKAAIVTALRAVTGQDIADDVGKWRSWLLKNNGK